MNKQVRHIIKSLLNDLATNECVEFYGALKNLRCPRFLALLREADCPEELIQSMLNTAELSHIERKYVVTKILKKLKEQSDGNQATQK